MKGEEEEEKVIGLEEEGTAKVELVGVGSGRTQRVPRLGTGRQRWCTASSGKAPSPGIRASYSAIAKMAACTLDSLWSFGAQRTSLTARRSQIL